MEGHILLVKCFLLVYCAAVFVNATICGTSLDAEARRRFAYNFYAQTRKEVDANQNIFLAPTTLASALAMVLVGAEGQTKDQIWNAMVPFNKTTEFSVDDLSCLLLRTDKASEEKAITLRSVSKLFGEKFYQFSRDFRIQTKSLGAEMEEVDFSGLPGPMREHINMLVANYTDGEIQDFFSDSDITAETTLAIVSAIYFKGLWKSPFELTSTKKETFETPDGSIQIDFMSRSGDYRTYFSEDMNAELLEIPYQKDALGLYDVSMILLLPETSMEITEARLTEERLSPAINSLLSEIDFNTIVSIPKFKISAEYDLTNILNGMGMTDMLTPGLANLSGMLNVHNKYSKPLYLKTAIHKTFLEVGEEGSTAAGATGLGFVPLSIPPSFICNRPFIVVVFEKKKQSILFIGRISNPEPHSP